MEIASSPNTYILILEHFRSYFPFSQTTHFAYQINRKTGEQTPLRIFMTQNGLSSLIIDRRQWDGAIGWEDAYRDLRSPSPRIIVNHKLAPQFQVIHAETIPENTTCPKRPHFATLGEVLEKKITYTWTGDHYESPEIAKERQIVGALRACVQTHFGEPTCTSPDHCPACPIDPCHAMSVDCELNNDFSALYLKRQDIQSASGLMSTYEHCDESDGDEWQHEKYNRKQIEKITNREPNR